LAGFLERLAAFRGTGGMRERVEKALGWSESVYRLTIEDHAEEWQQLNRRLRVHPDYGGLMLAPQVGLVPLGPDPDSKLEQFWFARSLEKPERPNGELQIAENTGIVLVLVPVPDGRTWIGSDPGPMAERNEMPRHEVALEPFFLGKYEMTQAQWQQWAGSNPSKCQSGNGPFDGHSPVESVSWLEAQAVLGQRRLCLPTEAQWEHACRAGTPTAWSFGDDRECLRRDGFGIVNIADGFLARKENQNYVPEAHFWPDFDDKCVVHQVVGSFPPNPWGFYDMHGNVAEWTRGAAVRDYQGVRHAPGDGLILGPDDNWAIHRGGSFWKRAEDSRSAKRTGVAKDSKYDNVGVRVCRPIDK
jgi:formylglycine-generating enzyme required for sulfatase activity